MLDRLIDFAVKRRVAVLFLAVGFVLFGDPDVREAQDRGVPGRHQRPGDGDHALPGPGRRGGREAGHHPRRARALRRAPRSSSSGRSPRSACPRSSSRSRTATDIYFARQQVAERLRDAEVPDGVTPTLGPNDTPVGQIYQYTLESDHHTPSELRSWQEWELEKHLKRVPGVADVVSFGGFMKEYHVLADPRQLKRRERPHPERPDRRGVAASNGATSGGYVSYGESEFVVRGRGYLKNPDDIEQTVITANGATPVLVQQRRARGRGVHAAARRAWRAERRARLGRGDDPAPARREPEGGARRHPRGDRPHQQGRAAEGHEDRPVLRPHPARRHDAPHGEPQHDRGRAARDASCCGSSSGPSAARSRSRSRCRSRCSRRSSVSTTRASLPICCPWARSTSASCSTAR